jgi:hypothetical protein
MASVAAVERGVMGFLGASGLKLAAKSIIRGDSGKYAGAAFKAWARGGAEADVSRALSGAGMGAFKTSYLRAGVRLGGAGLAAWKGIPFAYHHPVIATGALALGGGYGFRREIRGRMRQGAAAYADALKMAQGRA